jgi:hypothetical protein
VERRGSLRSGEMSQGSCKAGRGWDAQTAGDRLRGSSSVASRDRRSGRALHGRRLGRLSLSKAGGERAESRAESSTGCTGQTQLEDRHTGQTDSSWGAEQAAQQQRHPEALEGWHRERRCAMPKRTGAMLETQTTPEPSAAKASLMDGVRTTCRPTRPMLRARKKSENVSRALPGLAPGPLSRCQWQWGGAEPVAAVCRPVPVHSLRSASASQCLPAQDDGALSTQTLTLQARTTNSSAAPAIVATKIPPRSSPILHHDAQARLFVRCTGLPRSPPPPAAAASPHF